MADENEEKDEEKGDDAYVPPPPPVTKVPDEGAPDAPPPVPKTESKDEPEKEDGEEADADEDEDEEDEGDTPAAGSNEKVMGMLCHLLALVGLILPVLGNIGAPLAIWLLNRKTSKVVDVEGRRSVNFQAAFSALALVVWVPALVMTPVPLIGVLVAGLVTLLLAAGIVANVIFVILAVVAYNGGEESKYPLKFDVIGFVESKLVKKNDGD